MRPVSAIDGRPFDEPIDDGYDLQSVGGWAGMDVGQTHIEPARQVAPGTATKSAAEVLRDRNDYALAIGMADQLTRQFKVSPAVKPEELLRLRARGHQVVEARGSVQETMVSHILSDRITRIDNGEAAIEDRRDEQLYDLSITDVVTALDTGGVSISKRGLERAISAGVIPGFPSVRAGTRGGKPQRFAGREYVRTIKAILLARRS